MHFISYIPLIIAWLIFGLSHSFLASGFVKQAAIKIMNGSYKYYRFLYSVFATLLLIIVVDIHVSTVSLPVWQPLLVEKIIAIMLIIAGLAIMIACTKKYFMDLSGIDAILGKSAPLVLQTKGMHTYVRHPLYTGTLLFVWAIYLYAPYWNNLISCICITLYTLIGMYFEEKKLVVEYGDAYVEYQKQVPALLPLKYGRG